MGQAVGSQATAWPAPSPSSRPEAPRGSARGPPRPPAPESTTAPFFMGQTKKVANKKPCVVAATKKTLDR